MAKLQVTVGDVLQRTDVQVFDRNSSALNSLCGRQVKITHLDKEGNFMVLFPDDPEDSGMGIPGMYLTDEYFQIDAGNS